MAFYNQNQDEEENKDQGMNQQQQQQAAGGAVQLTSASANGVTAAGAGQANAPKPASSGMAPGFQAYTKANQGAATSNLANAAQSNVQNLGQQAQKSISQATNKFGQRVDLGSLKNRHQALQDVSNTVSAARNITAPAPQANALGQMDQSQVDRFKEVINAKYQGPESLRQSGLYNPAAQKVTTANQAVQNAGTAQGREELLRSMYEKRGDYTRGLNKLDTALLNSSKQGVQNLQNTAGNFKNISNELDRAQINSSNLAQNRTQEIKGIQEQARNTFTEGKAAEEAATEERLSKVIKDWDKLPEHFREIIRNKERDNKAVYDKSLAEFNSKNQNVSDADLQNSRFRVAQTESALAFTKNNPLTGKAGTPEQIAQAEQAYRQAQERFGSLSNQRNAYSSGLQSLQNSYNPNAVQLSAEEAAILGINPGEGLYNLGADAIKTAAYDKEKLISRDEQARQAALSALAGLDQSNRLDTNLKYSKAEKAGTQSAMDALDLEGIRSGLNEAETNFRDFAKNANLTGTGSKKNKRSGKRYYASESANLGNLLQNAGYDLNSELNSRVGNQDVLNKISGNSNKEVTPDLTGVAGGLDAYTNQFTNMGDGEDLATTAMNMAIPGASLITGALGMGSFGNAVSSLFGGGANSKQSKSIAAQGARADLENKIKGALDSSGFQNRFATADNDVTKNRLTALQQLLANMDKTNNR